MPGINVLIKGLNKVVNFPENTPMETIEQSIKVGWDQVEKISGLPMDYESRMARAKYLGFRPGMKLFHGTAADIGEFSLERGGVTSRSPVGKLGVSMALDPAVADEFASLAGNEGQNVIQAYHKALKPVRIELNGDEMNHEIAATVQDAWDRGFDAIKVDNYTTPNGEKGKSFILVKDPKQLRSVNAEFNPVNRNSGNLLGGLAGGAVGLGALSQSGESEAAQSVNRLLDNPNQSNAYPIAHPMLNKLGLTLQESPQSMFTGGIGKAIETISTGKHNQLTDEKIREIAIGAALDFL